MVFWKGYYSYYLKRSYIKEMDDKKFDLLWKKFKEYKGSQRDFYFTYVNPMKLLEKK